MYSADADSSEHPIRSLYEQIVISWNRRDTSAMAARFEEGATSSGTTAAKPILA